MADPSGGAIAHLLARLAAGDAAAKGELFSALYDDLHRLAQSHLRRSSGPLTLSATTLLHEAYLDISGREGSMFPDRARFMGYAARVMRGLIIDYSRTRQAAKRGGRFEITSLGTDIGESNAESAELERIGEALDELAGVDPDLAQIVDLKFFCGFSFVEIAAMRGVSERTVQRGWEKARLYLHGAIRDSL